MFAAVSGLEITPHLPPGVTLSSTVTTTLKDFDNEPFSFITDAPPWDKDGDYDPRYEILEFLWSVFSDRNRKCYVGKSVLPDLTYHQKYCFRYKFERTAWPTLSITPSVIYRTEPVYVSGNPFTVGLLNTVYDADEKFWSPRLPLTAWLWRKIRLFRIPSIIFTSLDILKLSRKLHHCV